MVAPVAICMRIEHKIVELFLHLFIRRPNVEHTNTNSIRSRVFPSMFASTLYYFFFAVPFNTGLVIFLKLLFFFVVKVLRLLHRLFIQSYDYFFPTWPAIVNAHFTLLEMHPIVFVTSSSSPRGVQQIQKQ